MNAENTLLYKSLKKAIGKKLISFCFITIEFLHHYFPLSFSYIIKRKAFFSNMFIFLFDSIKKISHTKNQLMFDKFIDLKNSLLQIKNNTPKLE
jgi:hypothetical protein